MFSLQKILCTRIDSPQDGQEPAPDAIFGFLKMIIAAYLACEAYP
jgi:hypothetical protein